MAVIPQRVVHERPVLCRPNMSEANDKEIVCAYARVSTESDEQEDSFERQVEHFTNYIRAHQNWTFGGVYADHGISGTRADSRPEFMKMIEQCRAGKINRILVKSISRFARNTVDSLSYIRELKALCISIFFENENIDTLTPGGEVLITIMSAIAEQESRNMSTNIKWAFQRRFKNGDVIINYKRSLGYTKVDGHYVPVLEEAEVIIRIFQEVVKGRSLKEIADGLTADGIKTATGKSVWSVSSVLGILNNEKYTGNALMGKTFKPDVLSKHRIKNEGQAPSFYVENSHPAIVPMELYEMAHAALKERKNLRSGSKTGKGRYSPKYPLGRLMVCADCGSKFRRHLRKQKNGKKVPIWVCVRHELDKEACNMTPLREDLILEAYKRAVGRLMGDVTEIYDRVEQQSKDLLVAAESQDLGDCEIELARCHDAVFQLYRARRNGEITDAEYNQKYSVYAEQIKTIQDEKTALLNRNNELKLAHHRMEQIAKRIAERDMVDITRVEIITELLEQAVVRNANEIEFRFRCGDIEREKLKEDV